MHVTFAADPVTYLTTNQRTSQVSSVSSSYLLFRCLFITYIYSGIHLFIYSSLTYLFIYLSIDYIIY